jgi:DNA-binding winged helix-turn-helix (wHTH) protein
VIWAFESYELDEQNFALNRAGRPVELRRKVFDVLHYLVRHHDRMVSKEELLQQVWPGETIQEAVVAQNIAILRKLLGDTRGDAKVIQTVHGRGYRFVADVTALPKPSTAAAKSSLPPPPSAPLVGR